MSKTRKTRAQKLRTAARRHQEITVARTARAVPTPIAVSDSPPPSTSQPTSFNPRRQLGRSTGLLVALVAAQLLIWLLFKTTGIDEKLWTLIKI